MTVLDEMNRMGKYKWLTFIEFLDMLCRMIITAVTRIDAIENNAHFLIGVIYQRLYGVGQLDRAEFPLHPPEEELRTW